MEFNSINPYTGKTIATHLSLTTKDLDLKLEKASVAFLAWKDKELNQRVELLKKVSCLLRLNKKVYAETITLEMGKPITEAVAEVEKCAWVCDYYASNAASFLKDDVIETDASKSYVRHDPIGSVLAIMPWNFPFWQVFRFAAPTLTAGNTALLKHAPNVFGCAKLIEEIFLEAGYPDGVFQNLIVHHEQIERIIAHKSVKAVSLTGSENAGKAVAQLAGKHLKKCLLELGGNNAFIVLEDADVDLAVNTAVTARMMNTGQSCIAAKRFIICDGLYHTFVSKFIKKVQSLKIGNPLDKDTQIGPLARKDLASQLHNQVQESIQKGAKLLLGGRQDSCFYEPTVLENVTPKMSVFKEETFGPVAAFVKVGSVDEAFSLAEKSNFGLGLSVFTTNVNNVLNYAKNSSDAAFFVNELVKSDPRLPFGGTKNSGYGRELSKDGMLEFVNRKTVYLK